MRGKNYYRPYSNSTLVPFRWQLTLFFAINTSSVLKITNLIYLWFTRGIGIVLFKQKKTVKYHI